MALRVYHAALTIILIFHGNHGSPIHGFMDQGTQWQQWKQLHGKQYVDTDEEAVRKQVWHNNMQAVFTNNAEANSGDLLMAMNAYGDQNIKRPIFELPDVPVESIIANLPLMIRIPDYVDWRTKGVVNPVRNQGQLGSAAAIVAADAVASFHAIHTGSLKLLSDHEVIDCCSWTSDSRLRWRIIHQIVDEVFTCIHNISGLCEEASYKPDPSGKCQNESCTAVAKVPHGSKYVSPPGDESALAAAVAMTPVFALVDASLPSFQFYISGIYDDPECSPTVLDHVLLIVGYGTSAEGEDYWICQNSWGVSWGMQGYIFLARNKGNRCGLATHASYPY